MIGPLQSVNQKSEVTVERASFDALMRRKEKMPNILNKPGWSLCYLRAYEDRTVQMGSASAKCARKQM